MPNPKVPKPKPEAQNYTQYTFHLLEGAEWGGFINVRVDDQQKLDFSSWYEENVNVSAQILEELLAAGMKVTLAYDAENDSWLCSFTGRLVADSPDRFVTTTRAGSMAEVIALACYKHVYIVRGVYKRYSNNNKPLWG